jgi:rfaE bifunctional protein kinase chain/domain
MSNSDLNLLFSKFNSLRALVIGDVMIDAYCWGTVERISPEAPVPILSVDKRESRLGGAANVALNLLAMGAEPVICAVIGADTNGQTFRDLLEKRGLTAEGTVASNDRVTTVKTRIISSNQQMLRIDEERATNLSSSEEELLLNRMRTLLDAGRIDVIVFEDYNKGTLTQRVISETIKEANKRGIVTTVDPKKANFDAYRDVTLFKPNVKELKEGLNIDFDPSNSEQMANAARQLRTAIPHKISLVTLSEHGVFVSDGTNEKIIPAHIRKISDVSGAGDTVISVASLCLALDINLELTAALANLAGGQVCEKVGVVPVDKKQLLAEAQMLNQEQ